MEPSNPSPLATLNEAAAAVHETYLSLVLAGFTEGQALYLVAQRFMARSEHHGR